MHSLDEYEVRPRRDSRGGDLVSDVLPFGRLWYDTPDNAVGYAMHSSRSHDAVIRVYDAAKHTSKRASSKSRSEGSPLCAPLHSGKWALCCRAFAAPARNGLARIANWLRPELRCAIQTHNLSAAYASRRLRSSLPTEGQTRVGP
jgi:hypothetical protein